MRIVVDRRSEGLEMFMFDDACIRHVGRGVVDDGVALMIGFVEYFGLEAYGAILQLPETIAVEFIYFTREYDFVGH